MARSFIRTGVGALAIATAAVAGLTPRHARAQGTDSSGTARRDTLESVVIRATRAPAAVATARSQLNRATLQRVSFGQDAPLALLATPSATAYSESGAYSGYSYLRLRGIDQTRLNITVDGVPLNDPEDQVLYFSNLPDFVGSMSSVEIGRGVGSSTFGTATFAGSLNFQSMPLATTPRGGQADLSVGSFDTWRASMQGATGVTEGNVAAYGRFSRQGTSGYRERSGNDAWSGFGSAAWFGTRDVVKVTAMAGLSATRLAYYAAAEDDLASNRRLNPLTDAEGDRFHQELASIQYSRTLASGLEATLLGYRNSAAGTFDVYFGNEPDGGGPTYGNFGLAHVWHGLTTALTWQLPAWHFSLGGSASDYHRDHWLAMRPNLAERMYTNTGVKRDAAAFGKASWTRGALRLGGDLQARYVRFRYRPSANAGIHPQPVTWSFVNPKLGASWDRGGRVALHATAGRTWREPSRADLLAGTDDLNAENINDILPFSRIHPEKVDDVEAGATWRFARATLAVNLFAMEFHNEIAPIGKLSLTGLPLRKNVESSYRRGVELEGRASLGSLGELSGNVAAMRARIADYDDEAAGVRYRDIEPLLTPPFTANARWTLRRVRGVTPALAARHVSRMHLANDGNTALVVPPSTVVDAAVEWRLGGVDFRLDVMNLLNANAYAGGYTDGATRYFFPVATRNAMVTARRAFGGFAPSAAR